LSSINDRAREVRSKNGLSIRGFAALLADEGGYPVSHSSVAEYEGDRTIPAEYISAVAQVFRVNPVWLLTGEGPYANVDPGASERAFLEIADVVDRVRPAPSGTETELRLFFELSPQLFAVLADGYFVRLNDEWKETLGWTLQDLMARPFVSFLHEDDRDEAERVKLRALRGDLVVGFRSRFIRPDGTLRWLSCSCRGVGNRLYAVASDVTEAVAREEEVEGRLAEFSRIVSRCPHGILVHRKGKLHFANPAAARILGAAEPETLRGTPIWSLFPDHGHEFVGGELTETMAESPFRRMEVIRLDGELLPAQVASIPVLHAKEAAVQVVIHPQDWPS